MSPSPTKKIPGPPAPATWSFAPGPDKMNDNSNTASDDENVLETSPRALRRTASLPSLSDNDSVACAKVGLDPIANARSNAILAKAVKHNTAVIARHFLQWEEETKLREEKLKAVIVELSDRITRLEVEVLGKGDEQTDEEDINAPVRAAVLLQGFLSRLDTTEERQGDLEGSQETMTRRMVSVEKQIDVVARANNEKDAKQMDSMKEKVKNLKSAVDSMKEATEVSKGLSTTVKELIDGKASKRQVTDLRAFAMSEIADVEKRVVSKFRQTQPPVNPEASIKSQLGPITDEVRQMTARVGDMESQLQVALAENKALRARLSTMGADDGGNHQSRSRSHSRTSPHRYRSRSPHHARSISPAAYRHITAMPPPPNRYGRQPLSVPPPPPPPPQAYKRGGESDEGARLRQRMNSTFRGPAAQISVGPFPPSITGSPIGNVRTWFASIVSPLPCPYLSGPDSKGIYRMEFLSGEEANDFCDGWKSNYPTSVLREYKGVNVRRKDF
ncbi:hypothetical protein D9757_013667 [Collybiopsis confluens]|uniref:Uncharacterized protein n=1 Tax=Collybiopsis confluens TaxID=2823264 RepID=A0A8H5GD86_9AGAR|nr:hypothetical protein D9757_013667 [Collybiopsis confluens]